jgi:hypothetical protein
LVTLDGQNAPGMIVIALVEGNTIGVGEIIEWEGGTYINISLYAVVGDEVSFQLFDPAACALYDTEITYIMESGVTDLGSFDEPEDLPFLSGNFILGCTDEVACNFDANADLDDGSCAYAEEFYDCDGNCLNDADEDGICDGLEVDGCQDETACNYDAAATDDDGSCTYAFLYYDCDGNCLSDSDGDLICDEFETAGCQDEEACNYNADATDDDGSCDYSCLGCTDEGACNFNEEASEDDGSCDYSCQGCTDESACNYDVEATVDDGSCTYAFLYYDCDGNCLNDADDDGICDEFEMLGCLDELACNYDSTATDSDSTLCVYPMDLYGVDYVDCEGNCLSDLDGDGICDEAEISGCQDETACNYNAEATDDDGACAYLVASEIVGTTGSFFGDTAVYTVDESLTENTYAWTVQGGTIIEGADSTTVVIVWSGDTTLAMGSVTVTETAEGCELNTLQLSVELTVNSLEEQSTLGYRLAPNPAAEGFRLLGPADALVSIRLLQRDGRVIERWQGRAGEWYSLEGLASGWYIVEIQDGDWRQVMNLMRVN